MRYWAHGGRVSDQEQEAHLREQAAMYGMDFAQFRAVFAASEDEPPEFLVYEDNGEPVEVFTLCGSQWRRDLNGSLTGIERPALLATLQMMGVQDMKSVFLDVCTMERAFIEERAFGEQGRG